MRKELPVKLLRIASDLHLEWVRDLAKHQDVLPPDELDKESILVLAGDIGSGKPLLAFLNVLVDRFPHVVYIPGNHEYYGSQGYEQWNEQAEVKYGNFSNLTFAPGTIEDIEIDGLQIIATTLWTDCGKGDPVTMGAVRRGLNDFNGAIPNFSVEKSMELHEVAREGIASSLRRTGTEIKKVVVTHHTPSHLLSNIRWKGQLANAGFHSNCEDLMTEDWSPQAWVFGHTHDQVVRKIGKTLCVNNPKGYPNEYTGVNYEERCFLDMSGEEPVFV
jgi:predicted phosphodiesterase